MASGERMCWAELLKQTAILDKKNSKIVEVEALTAH